MEPGGSARHGKRASHRGGARNDLHGAYADVDDNALREEALIVLGRDARHHRVEYEDEGPGGHDWAWTVCT